MKVNYVPNLLFLFSIIFTMFPSAGIVSGQSTSPWNEVFNSDGTLRDDLTDLGEYSETVPWMNMEIPVLGNVLEASYHRYETSSGNVVIIPSATTLFFMTLNPSASGLLGSTGQVGNGAGVGLEAPGILKGLINSSPNLQAAWDTIRNSVPNHVPPDQFFQDVISGKTNIFTIGGSNAMSFLWELFRISINDHMLATTLFPLLFTLGTRQFRCMKTVVVVLAREKPPTVKRIAVKKRMTASATVLMFDMIAKNTWRFTMNPLKACKPLLI